MPDPFDIGGIAGIAGDLFGSSKSDSDRLAKRLIRERKARDLRYAYERYGANSPEFAYAKKKWPSVWKAVQKGAFREIWDYGAKTAAPAGSAGLKPFEFRLAEAPLRTAVDLLPPIGAAMRKIPLGRLAAALPRAQLGALSFVGVALQGSLMARAAIGPGHLGTLGPAIGPAAAAVSTKLSPRPPRTPPAPRNPTPVPPAGMRRLIAAPLEPSGPPVAPGVVVTAPRLVLRAPVVPPAVTPVPKLIRRVPFTPIAKTPSLLATLLSPFTKDRVVDLLLSLARRERKPKPEKPRAAAPLIDPGAPPFPEYRPGDQPLRSPLTPFEARSADCACPPKKRRQPRRPRAICYSGTYVELANGLRKTKRRKVPCQPSKKKSASPRAR